VTDIVNNINGFSGADFFVLDRIAENLELEELEGVLVSIQESRSRDKNVIEMVKGGDDTENLV